MSQRPSGGGLITGLGCWARLAFVSDKKAKVLLGVGRIDFGTQPRFLIRDRKWSIHMSFAMIAKIAVLAIV